LRPGCVPPMPSSFAAARSFCPVLVANITKTCPTACQGTSYPDTLKGTSAPNQIRGLGGNEGLRTGDLIQGFANRDLLFGNPGGDRIEGGNGIDAIFGGRGQDLLIGGNGNDHIDGGSGGDVIMVKDGYIDHVNCQGATTTSPTATPSTSCATAKAAHLSYRCSRLRESQGLGSPRQRAPALPFLCPPTSKRTHVLVVVVERRSKVICS
jgi:hypothetical protein